MFEYPLFFVFPAAMAFAGAMDLFTMTIPNRVSIVLLAAFVVAAPMAGLGLSEIVWHLAAFAAVLTVTITLFSMGMLGGGDAKLLAVASLWVGLSELLFVYFLKVAILGGVLALMILVLRRIPVLPPYFPPWVLRLHRAGGGIPYGLAIGGAALWVYPNTPWFCSVFCLKSGSCASLVSFPRNGLRANLRRQLTSH